MRRIPDDTLARLREVANNPPERAAELNEALRLIRSVCPDFAIEPDPEHTKRATFTLLDGVKKTIRGATDDALLCRTARIIVGDLPKSGERDSD